MYVPFFLLPTSWNSSALIGMKQPSWAVSDSEMNICVIEQKEKLTSNNHGGPYHLVLYLDIAIKRSNLLFCLHELEEVGIEGDNTLSHSQSNLFQTNTEGIRQRHREAWKPSCYPFEVEG